MTEREREIERGVNGGAGVEGQRVAARRGLRRDGGRDGARKEAKAEWEGQVVTCKRRMRGGAPTHALKPLSSLCIKRTLFSPSL